MLWQALLQFSLLLLDIATLPVLCVLTATGYRLCPAVAAWNFAPQVVHHANLMLQFFVLLHDVLLMLPAITVLMLTIYRVKPLYRAVSSTEEIPNTHEDPDVEQSSRATPGAELWLRATSGWSWRAQVWRELGQLLCDLPFVVLGLIVACSVWRTDLALKAMCSGSSACQIRKAIGWQFGYLARDIALTPLLVCVVASLIRIPEFISGLLATCSSAALAEAPVLRADGGRVRFPEAKDMNNKLEVTTDNLTCLLPNFTF